MAAKAGLRLDSVLLAAVVMSFGCNHVSGISVVNDTAAPLAVEVAFSSDVRVAISKDCYDEGVSGQSPATVTLQPGQRACFLGPAGESSDYDLEARVTSVDVRRGGRSCLHVAGGDLVHKYKYDGRNAAQQKSFHIDDGACPP